VKDLPIGRSFTHHSLDLTQPEPEFPPPESSPPPGPLLPPSSSGELVLLLLSGAVLLLLSGAVLLLLSGAVLLLLSGAVLLLLSGELLSGPLLSGPLLSGPVPGALSSGPVPGVLPGVVEGTPPLDSSATRAPSATRAVNVTCVLSVCSWAVISVADACSSRTVNQPGWGAKATMRNAPLVVSTMIVADSPATTENWVAEPATGVGVSGTDAGVEAGTLTDESVEPLPGVLTDDESVDPLPGVLTDELVADAAAGMLRPMTALLPMMPAVANAAPTARFLDSWCLMRRTYPGPFSDIPDADPRNVRFSSRFDRGTPAAGSQVGSGDDVTVQT
jgi:hypothetical protein